MAQNKYLKTLGLQHGATEKEVISAYRRLSKKYHPDLSKDTNAKEKFIEIVEAYKFLTTSAPAPHNERTNDNVFDPAYAYWRQKAREAAVRRGREEAKMQGALIKEILKSFNLFTIVVGVFNLLLFLDYYLPQKLYKQTILGYRKMYENSNVSSGKARGDHKNDIMFFEDFTMTFPPGEFRQLKSYDKAQVQATAIFKKPISAIITSGETTIKHDRSLSVYLACVYLIPITFIGLVIYFFALKTLDQKLTFAIALVFFFVIQGYMFYEF